MKQEIKQVEDPTAKDLLDVAEDKLRVTFFIVMKNKRIYERTTVGSRISVNRFERWEAYETFKHNRRKLFELCMGANPKYEVV